jgi:DNA-binding MarR family transcriptional regulator
MLDSGYHYQLVEGDFAVLPEIEFQDLLPIIQPITVKQQKNTGFRRISRYAWKLLLGDIPEHFPTRSEAEQALIASLINKGYGFLDIERLFAKYPAAGKYKEKQNRNPDEAKDYLRISYDSALEWTKSNTSRGRRIAENAIAWAENRPWPGRTGTYDREVFLAHAQIAWRCGKVVYAASSRELAEIANLSHVAATNATHRLSEAGLLNLEKLAVANLANQYSLGQRFTLPQYKPVRKCKGLSSHDVFSYHGLTHRSKIILEKLGDGPKTAGELALLTGISKKTVGRWLKRMSRIIDQQTGEIIYLVYQEGDKWFKVQTVDLDRAAEILNVAGIQKQRKRIHKQQRDAHKNSLERGKLSGVSDSA